MEKIKAEITRVIEHTPYIRTFELGFDKNINFEWKPGQFANIAFDKDGNARPMSIANSPKDKGKIAFTVRLSKEFTTELFKKKEGDALYFEGPYGRFTLDDSKDSIVMIAGGVGISPFLGMIRSIRDSFYKKNIILFYSVKSKKDFVSLDELEDAQKQGWFTLVPILTSKDENELKDWEGEKSRIDKDMILKHVKNPAEKTFLICGIPQMVADVMKIISEIGVSKQDIRFEGW